MRLLVALCFLISAPCGITADTPAQRGDRAMVLKEKAAQETAQAALLAHSADGLLLINCSYESNGWAQVGVRNITASTARFDWHQVLGLELDTGKIVEAGNIRFNANETASPDVPPGGQRYFQVFFTGGRWIAAVAWRDRAGWRVNAKAEFAAPEEALLAFHKQIAIEALAQKKHHLFTVDGQLIKK